MTDREKLIELQKEACRLFMKCQTDEPLTDFIADHLIANGVTVQEWIPVTERLPEEGARVITLDKHRNIGIRCLKRFAGEVKALFRPDGLAPGKYITHWMPLPEPPKEE